ncbi:MAG: glycosyltransferase family 4 protein [Betaproteobacteria bacterium]|nr:glycosyltransferase family 4 protein [Betaproteobacteria bacterium]
MAGFSAARREGAGACERAGDAPARKPHVCFVSPYLWPVLARDPSLKIVGGAEVQQSILARLFRRAGYRVSVISLDYGQPALAEVDGISVHKAYRREAGIPVLRFLHPRLTSTWRAMREVDADIYYQRSAAYLTAVIAEFCRRHGKRSIYAGASDMDFQPGKQQIRYGRDRWLFEHGLANVDRIVVQNARQQEDCRRHYGREAVLVPSCYEPPPDSPRDAPASSRDLILWVGTIHTYKQPEIFLELARRLPARRFVLIGGSATPGTALRPGYFEQVQAEARSLPNVEFKGFLPLAEVEPWFDRARVFVNTSVYEGMPNTFMQAWARGIPTVATVDVGARLEGKPVYRTVQDVAQAAEEVERLFADELHWARSSARCREYFESSHSGREVLGRYERLFEELMAR